MSKCSGCCINPAEINSISEIPEFIEETKSNCKKEIKKSVNKKLKKKKGRVMKFLIKLIAKLIFKAALLAAAIAGVLFVLNKFAPEVFDSAYEWFKSQREETIEEKDEDD